jgi:cyclic pyranopterin phosphate synthase
MGEEGVEWMPHGEMLSFEEIERLCHVFAELGIKKIKITGGEPLVKKGVLPFIAHVRKIPGIEDVTLTTNGVLLQACLDDVIEAGVSSVNISLDSFDRKTFHRLSGRDEFSRVFASINAAINIATKKNVRVKINMVPLRGINDEEIPDFARFARDNDVCVRFIELMPLGIASAYTLVPNTEARERVFRVIDNLAPVDLPFGNGPAVYYTSPGMKGRIGFISAITSCFCETCNRLRLDCLGRLKPCLSSELTRDLKTLVRSGADNKTIKEAIRGTVQIKPKSHIFADSANTALLHSNMFKIGG